MKNKRDRLTVKQEKFCVNYFESGNATKAAIIAGYSSKTARFIAAENLTKPLIIERLNELQKAVASQKILSVVERKEKLSEIANTAIKSDMVTPDNAIRAIAELNKMEGDYAPSKHLIGQRVQFEVVYVDKTRLIENTAEPQQQLSERSEHGEI